MYGAFANPEPMGGISHSGTVFNNIGGQLAGALLNISLQGPTLPIPICSIYMRRGGRTCRKQAAEGKSDVCFFLLKLNAETTQTILRGTLSTTVETSATNGCILKNHHIMFPCLLQGFKMGRNCSRLISE